MTTFRWPALGDWYPTASDGTVRVVVDEARVVVWGEDDQIVSAKAAPLWMAGLPNATLKLMPRVGHLVLTESPEAVKLVADFMA